MKLDGQLADPSLAETLGGFVLLRMDLTDRSEKNPARPIAQRFGVSGIPDVRVLDGEGKEKSKVRGRSARDLQSELKAALGK